MPKNLPGLRPRNVLYGCQPLVTIQVLQSNMAVDRGNTVSLPDVVKASISYSLSNSTKWRAAIRNYKESNRHIHLSTLTSLLSYFTLHHVHNVGSANGAIKSSFLNYTKLFCAPKLGRSVVRRGFRSPSAKASFDHFPNSSKREISKMD